MKILLILMFPTIVKSFYRYGHTKFGSILEQNLKLNHPELHVKLNKYLELESGLTIEDASVWADRVKRDPKYCWASTMHYINIYKISNEKEIMDYCKTTHDICLYNGIKNYMIPKDVIEFKFLIHLTQDLFQPLHIYGKYNGGNKKIVTIHDKFKNGNPRVKKLSMHALWDDYLIKKQFQKTPPEEYIKNHTTVPNTPLDDHLLQIINDQVDLSVNMVYSFEKPQADLEKPKADVIFVEKPDVIFVENYYHEEYSLLINEYLTFMKNIIIKWD